MKAYLLAAGLGTRLKPLTDHIPKCLVPINGQPLLGIWFELCARHGISEVLVNLHHLPDAVRAFVAAYRGPLSIVTVFEPSLLGSAGTVASQRDFVAGGAVSAWRNSTMLSVLFASSIRFTISMPARSRSCINERARALRKAKDR